MTEQAPNKNIWPCMRGNFCNTGCSMHELDLKKDAVIKYHHAEGGIFSTPIIGENDDIFVGSADKNFYAIDVQKNIIKWKFATKGVIDSAACMDEEGDLYIPSGDASLHKLSSHGEKKWEFNISEKKYPRVSSIFWWEGNVVVGPNGWIYAGNDDFYFYAIDKEGNLKWSFPTGLQIWSAAAFNEGMVYFTSFDMHIYALDESTGKLKWKKFLGNFIASSPAIGKNGNVYVGTFGGELFCLSGKNGATIWKIKVGRNIYGSVALAPDGKLFIGAGDGFIYCVDSDNGKIVWSFNAQSPVWGSAVIGKDPEDVGPYLVYFGTSVGTIFVIDFFGKKRWGYAVENQRNSFKIGVNASLALGTSVIVATTTDGSIVSIPYNAYLQKPGLFNAPNVSVSIVSQQAIPSSLGQYFSIQKMEFTVPEIINPLDQVGIASLSIDVGIVKEDGATGRFVAWGVQAVGEKDDALGIPYPRRHLYAFNGVRKEKSIFLEAKKCDFDITAFPIPLDILSFDISMEGNQKNHFTAFLDCNNLFQKVAKKFGINILIYALKNTYLHISQIFSKAPSIARFYIMLWHLLVGKTWKSLSLIDNEKHFDGQGFFFINAKAEDASGLVFKKAFFDKKNRRIIATFINTGKETGKDYPGILLVHKNPLEVIELNYEKNIRIREKNGEITCSLSVPKNIENIEALILVNTKVQKAISL